MEKASYKIQNAGIVLLHPFLNTYFEHLNLLKGNDFTDQTTRFRAGQLLAYLCSGSNECLDEELLLNKILCGVAFAEPFGPAITISQEEEVISMQLLTAVLSKWEKLKNTSVLSFQESFLQRDGVLVLLEGNWTLTIEQRGYDVLLQSLPWSISEVKTPWMTAPIEVKWV